MAYVMQHGNLYDEHGERIGQVDTGGEPIKPGVVSLPQHIADSKAEKERWREVFAHPAVQGRSDMAKTLLAETEMTPAEIIAAYSAAPGGTGVGGSKRTPPGDLYAAGGATAKRLVGMPTATISDQREPTDAEKQQFERHCHVGQE
jgi:hypothetical protein